jgi:hypothetical protein
MRLILSYLALLGGAASLAWGGLSSCGSTTYNLGTGTNGLVSPGTASAGCEQVDAQFSNFAYNPNVNGLGGPSASSVSANFGGSTPTGGISATFSSSGWSQSTATSLCCAGSSLTFGAAIDISQGDYAFTSVALTVNSPTIGDGYGNQLNVYLNFCLASTLASCSTGNTGQIHYSEYSFQFTNPTTIHTANYVCFGQFNGSTYTSCTGGLSSVGSATTISMDLTKIAGFAQGTQLLWLTGSVSYDSVDGTTVALPSLVATLGETNEAPEPATGLLCLGALTFILTRRKSL